MQAPFPLEETLGPPEGIQVEMQRELGGGRHTRVPPGDRLLALERLGLPIQGGPDVVVGDSRRPGLSEPALRRPVVHTRCQRQHSKEKGGKKTSQHGGSQNPSSLAHK